MSVMQQIATLVGAGDRIGRAALPFLLVGVTANVLRPSWFAVGGRTAAAIATATAVLFAGIVVWLWSVFLIATKVRRGELVTSGPFAVVKHPLYTGVSLLVLPAAGFLVNTWLGLALGLVVYAAARVYAPAEEEDLERRFGPVWHDYVRRVLIPWL
jgi:protein-S-isoprenylcysteine O-methyltransferase Ste14